nr:hypothetical protein [Tanacetum cinerariifolium]
MKMEFLDFLTRPRLRVLWTLRPPTTSGSKHLEVEDPTMVCTNRTTKSLCGTSGTQKSWVIISLMLRAKPIPRRTIRTEAIFLDSLRLTAWLPIVISIVSRVWPSSTCNGMVLTFIQVPFITHTILLDRAFAYCPRFPTAAPCGSPGRVSVPVWLIIRKDNLSIIGLIPMRYAPVRHFVLNSSHLLERSISLGQLQERPMKEPTSDTERREHKVALVRSAIKQVAKRSAIGETTVAGMKDRSGTELCCLLGLDGGTGIFGGKKAAPFSAEWGSIAFCRVVVMPFRKKRPRRKKRKSSILKILDITEKEVEL